MTHKNKQCYQCEKNCDGLTVQAGQSSDCDVMEISEYERLVASQTRALQQKMTIALDELFPNIASLQTDLMDKIKLDPRKTDIFKTDVTITVTISEETDEQFKNRNDPNI